MDGFWKRDAAASLVVEVDPPTGNAKKTYLVAKIFGNRWEVVRALPEGGQAHAFIVRDREKNENDSYVLKRLKNIKRLVRFEREVAATLKLEHENILRPIAHDLSGDQPYLVTEYCSGGTLRDVVEAHKPSLPECFRLFIAVADAVNHAHTCGVVHRDLKPDNIFVRLPNNDPVVGDFGLCYFTDDDSERHTLTDEGVGPRIFAAPELEDGRIDQVLPSADVYSLGKIFYWLVSGGLIFSREKLREEKWNLAQNLQHPFEQGYNKEGEHITRLLEQMITADPSKRASLSDIILSAKRVQRLIHVGVNPVGFHLPQNCTYCGWGRYECIAADSTGAHNFGLNLVGNPQWRILACRKCGHVQLFRLDEAKWDDLWNRYKNVRPK